jgi:HK97 family phage major capsid protein
MPNENDPRSTSRGMTGGEHRSIGGLIVSSPEFSQVQRGGRKSISLDFPHISNFRAATRAALGTADFGGTVEHTGAVVFANQRLTVADLLAGGVTGSGTIRFPQEQGFTPAAEVVPEGSPKPEQTLELASVDAACRKIAAFVRISDELLQDSPASQSYIDARLGNAVMIEEENQILAGDGQGSNMLGILNTEGLQSQARGEDNQADAIRRGIGKIDANTNFVSDGIVLHPNDWMTLQLLKDQNNQYLCGSIFTRDEMGMIIKAPSIWGLPVVISKAMPAGNALVGAFKVAAQLFRRHGLLIELSNSDGDNFTKNLLTIRAENRATLAVYAPAAFTEVTGL